MEEERQKKKKIEPTQGSGIDSHSIYITTSYI